MILFLDFDGVLHHFPCEDRDLFCRLPLLWRLLRKHPEIEVVFSTAWREQLPLAIMTKYVTQDGGEDLAPRFVGATPHDIDHDVACESRLIECESWLAENGRERECWIALDDIPILFGHKPGQNVYLVNRDHGLRDHDVEAISAMIGRLGK